MSVLPDETRSMTNTTPALEVKGLVKTFAAKGNSPAVQAVDGINLEIQAGEFFGLLGPNGAGKTTLINSIAGLSKPTSGSVRVMGHCVQSDYRQARMNVGIVPQEIVFDPFFSVRETLLIQSGYFGIRNNEKWIDELLAKLALSNKANANMRQLSGGMKRRVMVAQALVHRPPVIVLDEPTAGVDVELRKTLWAFVQELNTAGHTILLTTHYLEEAQQLCNRVAMVKRGKVVALDRTEHLLAGYAERVLRLKLGQTKPAVTSLAHAKPQADGWWAVSLAKSVDTELVLKECREANVTVHDLELSQPDLEEAFIAIMNEGAVKQSGKPSSSGSQPEVGA
jgi:ABC-2 type transport system ATP-binding protein